jgi:hypothetical protein
MRNCHERENKATKAMANQRRKKLAFEVEIKAVTAENRKKSRRKVGVPGLLYLTEFLTEFNMGKSGAIPATI